MVAKENVGNVIFSKIEDVCFVAMISLLTSIVMFFAILAITNLPGGDPSEIYVALISIASSTVLGILSLKQKKLVGLIVLISIGALIAIIFLGEYLPNSTVKTTLIFSSAGLVLVSYITLKKRIILEVASVLALLIIITIFLLNFTGDKLIILSAFGSVLLGTVPAIFGKNQKISEFAIMGGAFGFVPGLVWYVSMVVSILTPLPEGAVAVEGPEFGLAMGSLIYIFPSILYGAFGGMVGYSVKWLAEKIKRQPKEKPKG